MSNMHGLGAALLLLLLVLSSHYSSGSFPFGRSRSLNDLSSVHLRLELQEMQRKIQEGIEQNEQGLFPGSEYTDQLLSTEFDHMPSLPTNSWDFETIGKRYGRGDLFKQCLGTFVELHKENVGLQKLLGSVQGEVIELQRRIEKLEGKLLGIPSPPDSKFNSGVFDGASSLDFDMYCPATEENIDYDIGRQFDDESSDEEFFFSDDESPSPASPTELRPPSGVSTNEEPSTDAQSETQPVDPPECSVCDHSAANAAAAVNDPVVNNLVKVTEVTRAIDPEPKSVQIQVDEHDDVGVAVKPATADVTETSPSQATNPITVTVVRQSVPKTHLVSIFAIMFAMLVLTCAMVLFVVVFKRIDRRYGLSAIDSIAQEQQMMAAAAAR